jgi:Zn-dependent peptidase ImmA (M78 family)
LERTLEEPLVPDEKLRGFRIKPRETGAAAASRLRQELDLAEDDKITSVTEIMDRLAIRSIELPTHMALDGFAAQADSEFVVVLNSAVKADRARLNAAHEIGHVLAGDCETDDIDNEGPNEKRAFDFASHLLLTDTMLREAFKQRSMVRLVQFKERFGISVAAMIYRAQKTRGLLPESVAKRIWIEINRRGWKHDEPGHVAEDRAIRFERLVDTALIEGRLTLEQAAELSGVRSDELRERREWALRLVAWQAPAPSVSREDEKPFLRLVT